MDLHYPLKYSNSSLAIITTEQEKKRSQIKHAIATVAGERSVYNEFGFPLEIIFSTGIAEIAIENFKQVLQQIENNNAQVSIISYERGRLKIRVELKTITVEETITINA